MPITSVAKLRAAIQHADIPEDMRQLGIDEHAAAILAAGDVA
jgi:hypothetical protein